VANKDLINNRGFFVEIISPEGEIFKDSVDEVILPTVEGEIAILPHHAPLFSKLTSGELIIKKSGKEIYVAITGGFLEINNNRANILADYAVKSEKIEIKQAEEAKKKAEDLLKKKEKLSEEDFVLIEKQMQKAILEINVSEKIRHRKGRTS